MPNAFNSDNSELPLKQVNPINIRPRPSTHQLNSIYPQGAVLSPFLWNLFIDDLLVLLNSHGIKCQAFADDCTILLEYDRKDIRTSKRNQKDNNNGTRLGNK